MFVIMVCVLNNNIVQLASSSIVRILTVDNGIEYE